MITFMQTLKNSALHLEAIWAIFFSGFRNVSKETINKNWQ